MKQLGLLNSTQTAEGKTVKRGIKKHCCYYYYYYLLQLSFHSVAVVLTLVQTKQE